MVKLKSRSDSRKMQIVICIRKKSFGFKNPSFNQTQKIFLKKLLVGFVNLGIAQFGSRWISGKEILDDQVRTHNFLRSIQHVPEE